MIKEQFETITEEIDENTLYDIIKEMDNIMKEKLSITFEQVRKEFKTVYRELFKCILDLLKKDSGSVYFLGEEYSIKNANLKEKLTKRRERQLKKFVFNPLKLAEYPTRKIYIDEGVNIKLIRLAIAYGPGIKYSDSRFINYSDQPYMAFREKVLELLEWANEHKEGRRTLNGLPSQETIINGPYWKKQKLKIAITDGVFAHARYDDSFRPDNAAYNPVQI